MFKYCGMLHRVGSHDGGGWVTSGTAVGNVRVAGEISVIEIGETVLRKVRCTSDLHDLLDPGQEACLYIFRHFFYKPVVLGVKYTDSGRKYTISFTEAIASALAYGLMFPLLIVFSGFMIGLMGGSEAGLMSTLAVAWIVGGIALAWACAAWLLVSYFRMKAD